MKHLTKKPGYLFIVSALVICSLFSCNSNNKTNNSDTKISSDSIANNKDTVINRYERKEIQQINHDEEKPAQK